MAGPITVTISENVVTDAGIVSLNVTAVTSETDSTLPTQQEVYLAYQNERAFITFKPDIVPTPDPPPGG
jgi:hypothetical protein